MLGFPAQNAQVTTPAYNLSAAAAEGVTGQTEREMAEGSKNALCMF